MTFRSTKSFFGFPCAHRQWKHEGNCKLVHGYSRSFVFVFEAYERTFGGFVVDFGSLKWLRGHLNHMFDHTLLLCSDDPFKAAFLDLAAAGACDVRFLPYGVGMEDTAQYLCEYVDKEIRRLTKGRAWVISVEARENETNSAIYSNPDAGFKGWL